MTIDVKQIGAKVEQEKAILDRVRGDIQRVIVGQEELIERLLVGLLCNNHILIGGVPGLAKTLSATPPAQGISRR